jgi:hypothetical protein
MNIEKYFYENYIWHTMCSQGLMDMNMNIQFPDIKIRLKCIFTSPTEWDV